MCSSVFILCILCMVVAEGEGQSIDQVIRDVLDNRQGSPTGDGLILVNGQSALLTEFDIAEPVACREVKLPDFGQSPPDGVSSTSEPAIAIWTHSQSPPCLKPQQQSTRVKRNINTLMTSWGTKRIPYEMNRELFTEDELVSIDAAFAEYAKYTCIRFIPHRTQQRYFKIIRGGGCWSYVGYQPSGNPQPLSLDFGCANSKRIPIHELFHLLGSWHQQSRPDRDKHITIVEDNIHDSRINQFTIRQNSNQYGTPYSYRSVMHYGRWAFTKNGHDTIITQDPFFQNKIGRGVTFSFEDLQVLHRHYNCDAACSSASCSADQYRGSDCSCYCKNDHIDVDKPAVECFSKCTLVNTNCACTQNKCSVLSNTVCNAESLACECDEDSGYFYHKGDCVLPSTVSCLVANEECLCTHNGHDACSAVPQSSCNTSSDKCVCNEGIFPDSTGACSVKVRACRRLGRICGCHVQEDDVCKQFMDSRCNEETGACECKVNFYQSSRRRCKQIPPCESADVNCMCSMQNLKSCRTIPKSYCNKDTDECNCLPYHITSGGSCVPGCDIAYVSDGYRVAPFQKEEELSQHFSRSLGDEPLEENMFGVRSNGYRLEASGQSRGDEAVIFVPQMSLENTDVCIEFNLKMNAATFMIEFRSGSGLTWNEISYHMVGEGSWGTPKKEILRINEATVLELQFKASMNAGVPDGSQWKVNVDPLIVRRCDCVT